MSAPRLMTPPPFKSIDDLNEFDSEEYADNASLTKALRDAVDTQDYGAISRILACKNYQPAVLAKLEKGGSILHDVVSSRDMQLLRLFLKVDIGDAFKLQNEQGETLIHLAQKNLCPDDMLRELLAHPACTDDILRIANNDGDTPLHKAVKLKKPNQVSMLLSPQYDSNQKIRHTRSKLQALQNKNRNTPLHEAINTSQEDCVDYLLTSLAEDDLVFQMVDEKNRSVLHCAVAAGNFAILNRLLGFEQCTQKVLALRNSDGETALYQAIDLSSFPQIDGKEHDERIVTRKLMVRAILLSRNMSPEAFACAKVIKLTPKEESEIARSDTQLKSGVDLLKKLKLDSQGKRKLITSEEIRKYVAKYFLESEAKELERYALTQSDLDRAAVMRLTNQMHLEVRHLKLRNATSDEMIALAFFVHNTRAFLNDPLKNDADYQRNINDVRKINRRWGIAVICAIAAVAALCILGLAITLAVATGGITIPFLAAAGIVLAKNLTAMVVALCCFVPTASVLAGYSIFVAQDSARRGPFANIGDQIHEREMDHIATINNARKKA